MLAAAEERSQPLLIGNEKKKMEKKYSKNVNAMRIVDTIQCRFYNPTM